jgi:DNA-binding response OmpR family regulator
MRLLIVEDNVRLATLMAKLVGDHGLTEDIAGSIDEARTALGFVDYDVVLLDLSRPDGDGQDILAVTRQNQCHAYVLVVTARGDVVTRVQALNAGADDYIVKPFSDDELIARIRAVGRRSRQIRDAIVSVGNVQLDTESFTLTIAGRLVTLSRRELSVLSALLGRHRRVLPKEKLEQAIYSLDIEVTANAVEAAVSRLRRRLDAEGATVDLVAMRGIGYILTERVA